MLSRPTMIAASALIALAFCALTFCATDAVARSHGQSHGARTSGFGTHVTGGRRGFGYYPYLTVPRSDVYTDYNSPVCASVRRRVQLDYGLRWHRARRCGY